MADQKRQITFETTMTADKRAESAAYLRKNVLSTATEGLYPARDFVEDSPLIPNTNNPVYIFDDGSRTWLINRYTSDRYDFWQIGDSSTTNPTHQGWITAAAVGGAGLYFVDSDFDEVYRVTGTSAPTLVGEFDLQPYVELGGWDGLQYWWVGRDIWRQLPGEEPVLMMDFGVPSGIEFLAFYGDEMVIFVQQGKDIIVLFYDKSNSAFFTRREIIRNANVLAGGVVEGLLMIAYNVGNTANEKEASGEIVIAGWNGQDFVRMNSIVTKAREVRIPQAENKGTTCTTGAGVMLFSVRLVSSTGNRQPDLTQNYIYKVRRDGSIEVVDLPPNNADADIVALTFGGTTYISKDTEIRVMTNLPGASQNQARNYANYTNFTSTEYATNFLTNPYNYKALRAVSVTFEKLFKNTDGTGGSEQLDLYYRVSDREEWTLLGTVTAEKVIENVDTRRSEDVKETEVPVNMQRYQFTKLPDNTALPEFNEIQFKFVLKNGMSITGAWFEYDYITRNTKR